MIKFHNTLGRTKEEFKPIEEGKVGIYTCGPTVYDYAHLGNLRAYVFVDVLKRVLNEDGFKVFQVENITDVGHLTSDADTGEDKIEKGAKREGKSAREIASFYTEVFKKDMKRLNILPPDVWAKATDHIDEQINLIKTLEDKGYTYKTGDGIYFDTSKLQNYGKLAKLDLEGLQAGRRVEMGEKKHPTDFALWKFSPGEQKREMEWESPWGKGFPGWHIECSAMSGKYLGKTFDIHTGGVDHIPVHHTNEIAQGEAATGKTPANYWLHSEFLLLKEGRMGKSEGNIITLEEVIKKGFEPLAFRYLCLESHYRSKMTFSWEILEAAQKALNGVRNLALRGENHKVSPEIKNSVLEVLNDDLDTPRALAILHKQGNFALWREFEPVFALGLENEKVELTEEQEKKIEERNEARKTGDFEKADDIRKAFLKEGIILEDTGEKTRIIRHGS